MLAYTSSKTMHVVLHVYVHVYVYVRIYTRMYIHYGLSDNLPIIWVFMPVNVQFHSTWKAC